MRKTLLAIGLMALSASSFAADKDEVTSMSNFNYDYAEARIGASPMTFGGGFSKSVHPNAHMVATIDSRFKGDFNLAAGFGFHAPVNNWADLTGEMLFRAVDNDSQDIDTGMQINLGVRQWLGPQFEVGGKVGYVSIKQKDEWTGSVYGRFHSTELFSIGLEGLLNDFYGDQFMMTARFKF